MPAESERYDLSPKAAGELIGVHADTIKRWVEAGKLPAFRTPGGWLRLRRSDIDALLTGQITGGNAA